MVLPPGPAAPTRGRLAVSLYPWGMGHVIDYVEFAVDDLAQAKAFYGSALGWAFNEYGDDYAGIRTPAIPTTNSAG